MSAYFQRLIRQSGLRVIEAAPAAAPLMGEPRPLPVTSATLDTPSDSGPEIVEFGAVVEVQEPRPAATTGLAGAQAPPPLPPAFHAPDVAVPPATDQEAKDAAGRRSDRPAARAAESLESTVVPTISSTPTAFPATLGAGTEAQDLQGAPLQANPLPDALVGVPPAVLQAVMRWIAAGSGPASTVGGVGDSKAAMPSAFVEPTVAPVPSATTSPSPQATAPVGVLPDRVISVAEELLGDRPSPPQQPGAPATAPPARPVAVGSEEPVRVSIGSIHVRVDAPLPPANVPIRAPRTGSVTRAAPASPPRSSGFSKLRRHYLIPH